MNTPGSSEKRPHVGYYVHHHGHGHQQRAAAVLRHVTADATVLTSAAVADALTDVADVVPLPMDTDRPARATPSFLHYAPLGSPGLRERMARIAAYVQRAAPTLFVVDVSVEVALFVRLLGVPVVVMRQHGDRSDAPHRAAFEAARHLLAPYPALIEDATTPDGVRAKTFYAGGFSRFDGRTLSRAQALRRAGLEPGSHVAVLTGRGGGFSDVDALAAAARATPSWTWTWLGIGAPDRRAELPENVRALGWVADPYPYLVAADVVVAHGGHNAVMEVAAAGRPLVCLPQPRPFGEQHGKAAALARAGLALTTDAWPAAEAWPRLLHEASALTAPLALLSDGGGARRAGAYLDRLARAAPALPLAA